MTIQKPEIGVQPKLYVQSKTTIGIVISVAGIVLSTLGQQPWLDPNLAKMVTTGGLILASVGQVDRKDLFFRPGEMQKAAGQAAANLTIVEAAQTIQQGLRVATAPAAERPGLAVDLLVDVQKRLSNQDAVLEAQNKELAEIRAAATAQQFPPYSEYPDRTDLPRDPRQRAQMEAPPVRWEPDVLQANDGVLTPGDVI